MSYTETKMVGDKEFMAALKKASTDTFTAVHKEAVMIANDVRNNIIKGMQTTKKGMTKPLPRRFKTVDKETGRRKSIRTGKQAKFHYPSLPGNYPAIDSGELVGSMMTDAREFGIEVGSVGVPHAEWTNEGTKNKDGSIRMKARPWLKPSFEKIPIGERMKEAFKRGGGFL